MMTVSDAIKKLTDTLSIGESYTGPQMDRFAEVYGKGEVQDGTELIMGTRLVVWHPDASEVYEYANGKKGELLGTKPSDDKAFEQFLFLLARAEAKKVLDPDFRPLT